MLSSEDLERLIAVKKREIQSEKTMLGLSSHRDASNAENKENKEELPQKSHKEVKFHETSAQVLNNSNGQSIDCKNHHQQEDIAPELQRYIRRHVGLPMMLKAGEFSPNNPLARMDQTQARDALLGLGEYERRSDALRRLRQREYREYLLKQAKKKQEAKEREIREQRECEQKDRHREIEMLERENAIRHVERVREIGRRDTGIQVASGTTSVAVQTDDDVVMRLSPQQSPSQSQKVHAERELSPRTVKEGDTTGARRKSYGDYNDRTNEQKCKDRLMSDLRHTYMPSIFDADAIQMRNLKAEQEAAAKRQCYQQELKNQIQEQQRIKEERKAREKLLEQAEMRRLEEQLKMLQKAQEHEVDKNQHIITAMAETAIEYENKRTNLQKEIEIEKQSLFRSYSQKKSKTKAQTKNNVTIPNGLTQSNIEKKPFSTNIPKNSLFSSQYDVDSYLRRNLNPKSDSLTDIGSDVNSDIRYSFAPEFKQDCTKTQIVRADVHAKPSASTYEPSFLRKDIKDLIKNVDDTPIPLLKHSISPTDISRESKSSEAMQKVEDKWRVPIVQKNILKSLPSEGKNVSILTQLGSIRRQLQLEQMRLDNKLYRGDQS